MTLLVTLAALTLTVLAPAFHYHQFGESARMARDAGFSALLMGGSVMAVFGTIRAFRREIESGTLQGALSHPISRTTFFLSKTAGVFLAYLVFASVIFGTMVLIVQGSTIGGLIAKQTGGLARIYGPCLLGGLAVILLPLILAAGLNRFGRMRFVLSSLLTAFILAIAAFVWALILSSGGSLRFFPVALLLILPMLVLLSATAAFAIRFNANTAAACSGCVFALLLPALGNYYLVDALAHGGSLPSAYLALAVAVILPAFIAFLWLGIHFINGRDVSWTR